VDVGLWGRVFQDPGTDLPILFLAEPLNPTYAIAGYLPGLVEILATGNQLPMTLKDRILLAKYSG
jgi:hypothetical protein